jgi:hypothetical protein
MSAHVVAWIVGISVFVLWILVLGRPQLDDIVIGLVFALGAGLAVYGIINLWRNRM